MVLLALILVPFAGGIWSAMARTRGRMEMVNLAAFAVTFVLSLVTRGPGAARGPVSLWSGFLYADSLSALVCLLTAAVAAGLRRVRCRLPAGRRTQRRLR